MKGTSFNDAKDKRLTAFVVLFLARYDTRHRRALAGVMCWALFNSA